MPDWRDRPADITKAGEPGHDQRGRVLKGGAPSPGHFPNIDPAKNGLNNSKKALQRRVLGEKKLTPKQEKFAQLMATQQHTQTDAAIQAGFTEKHAASTGSRLMKDETVMLRINELMVEAGKRNEVTVDEIIEKLRETYEAAFIAGRYSDANKSLELLAKYLGMLDRTLPNAGVMGHVPLTSGDDQKDAERLAKIAALARQSLPAPEGT